MAPILRYRFHWSGASIGSGTSALYCDGAGSAQAFATACQTFLTAATKKSSNGDVIPLGISISSDNVVDQLEATTGKLTGQSSVTPGTTVTGTGGQGYSAASGACITWNTGDFHNGRRIRGRFFIVPLAGVGLDNNGTLDDTYRTAIINAANALITSAVSLVVWHRPTTKGGSDGGSHFVQSPHVTDKVAILTSRR